jgi:hypothetical protein
MTFLSYKQKFYKSKNRSKDVDSNQAFHVTTSAILSVIIVVVFKVVCPLSLRSLASLLSFVAGPLSLLLANIIATFWLLNISIVALTILSAMRYLNIGIHLCYICRRIH